MNNSKEKIELALKSYKEHLEAYKPSISDRYSWSFFENQYENTVGMIESIVEAAVQKNSDISKDDLIGYLKQLTVISNDFIRKLYEQDS